MKKSLYIFLVLSLICPSVFAQPLSKPVKAAQGKTANQNVSDTSTSKSIRPQDAEVKPKVGSPVESRKKARNQSATKPFAKPNKQRLVNRSITKIVSPITKQEFLFLGCPGNEESFKEVAKVLEATQIAWNSHQLEGLLKHYSPVFSTKDGFDVAKVRENLKTFWAEYPNAAINSLPATISVCGNSASASLNEETNATGQPEGSTIVPFAPQFRGWIQGITTLKKVGGVWKIVAEEILSEEMWKFYGPNAEKLLTEGKIKLDVPDPVKAGENYITQLKYTLPENVQGQALIDKILLTEFPEEESKTAGKKAKADENAAENSLKKKKELQAILRSTTDASEEDGLRRLFTANKLGQDELVRAQVELITYDKKGPSLFGIIGMSRRVVPKPVPQKDKSKDLNLSKSLKDEASSKANPEKK